MPIHSDTIARDLSGIRVQTEDLNIPISAFIGVGYKEGEFRIFERGAEEVHVHMEIPVGEDDFQYISEWLRTREKEKGYKYIGAALSGEGDMQEFSSLLWLDNDIATLVHEDVLFSEEGVEDLATRVRDAFDEEELIKIVLGANREVMVHDLVSKDAYIDISTEDEVEALDNLSQKLKGKKIRFISATPQGGGVALMRHALIRLLHLWDVDASWHVLEERADAFLITKTKFHNVLQGVAENGTELTDKDRDVYTAWMHENAEALAPALKDADVIIIDDPQPVGLIPVIQEMNPDAKIIYRSHIQIVSELVDTKGTPQSDVWDFIWNFAQKADIFISHPIPDFVPSIVPQEDVVFAPPTTDPLDGLNKPLTSSQMDYYYKLFDKILIETNQVPLDHSRPYVIQVARFDPSKGIPDVLDAFNAVYGNFDKGEKPQLVIVGNGSIDDPDGVPIYNLVMDLLEREYPEMRGDVKVARLPHIDQLLNTLMRGSTVALQLSHREGFEVKVTEALMVGKPIISYRAGGIPLQMKDGVSGFVVETIGDTEQVAKHLLDLLTDAVLYDRMSTAARRLARRDVLTMAGAINWLFLANLLLEEGSIPEGVIKRARLNRKMKKLPSHLRLMKGE